MLAWLSFLGFVVLYLFYLRTRSHDGPLYEVHYDLTWIYSGGNAFLQLGQAYSTNLDPMCFYYKQILDP